MKYEQLLIPGMEEFFCQVLEQKKRKKNFHPTESKPKEKAESIVNGINE